MVVVEVINNSEQILTDAIVEVGKVGKWLEAIGLIVILWITFQIVSLIINKKKIKTLDAIKKDLKRIEKKVDLLNRR